MAETDETLPTLNLRVWPDGGGTLRQVMLGLDRPVILMEPLFGDDDSITLSLDISGMDAETAAGMLAYAAMLLDPDVMAETDAAPLPSTGTDGNQP